MARNDESVILYAAELGELRSWIGANDPERFEAALGFIREELEEDEDSAELKQQELAAMEPLLRRVIFEGKTYEGLAGEERYYMAQVLYDLLDEYVDLDALSEALPLGATLQVVEELPRGSEAARMARWLVRGRELDSEALLWPEGAVELTPFFGYVSRQEVGRFTAALDDAAARLRKRPSGIFKQLRNAADECARAELDLVSIVG